LLTVAIIGAGPLGRRLAVEAARAGYRVFLEDVMPANLHHAREAVRRELSPEAIPSVAFVSTIEEAVREADLAIDCVPDELESKLEIFCLLDRMAPPRTVLATPTTALSIADLAACTYRADKCIAIVADPPALTNPDPKAESGSGRNLVLRLTPQTAPEAAALVQVFFQRVGFTPHTETESAPQS
jgi:3-hydroxybutyryl-CoA dehydrogenase